MHPDKILPLRQTRWRVKTNREGADEKGCFCHVLIWMTWQQSRPNRHWETTAVVLGERTDWRRAFQSRHLQPTACHIRVAEAEVHVNAVPRARSGQVFMWLRRSYRRCKENTQSRYWFGPGFSCCGCLLALDFAFVLRRHLPRPDCQLTDQIPEVMAGCRPTQ